MTVHAPRRPAVFLCLFALATALSLPVWDRLSGFYMAGLIELVNAGLRVTGSSLLLNLPAMTGGTIVYPGVAGAVALFLVTPGRSLAWKAGWMSALLAVLCGVHAGVLLAEVLLAARQLEAPLVLRVCRAWGTSVIVIGVWFAALRRTAGPAPES